MPAAKQVDEEELSPEEIRRRKEAGARLARGRKAKAAQEARAEKRRLRAQLVETEKAKAKANRKYFSLLKQASAKSGFDKELWDQCDRQMALVLQLGAAIKHIEKKLKGGT